MKAFWSLLLCAMAFVPVALSADAPSGEDLERSITKEQVVALVELTEGALKTDVAGTIQHINKGDAPYKDAKNPTLYVFVYSTDLIMVAHPRADLVGKSVKGKPDVKGKKFRDEILARALAEGKGWVDYFYQKPGETGIHHKTTYFQRVQGADGSVYVVCAGMYVKEAPAKQDRP